MTALEKLKEREAGIAEWLRQNAPELQEEQKHLDEDSFERKYWHYGYLVALRDVAKLLNN